MSKPESEEDIDLEAPLGLAASTVVLGAEEFVLLEFPLPGRPSAPPLDTGLSSSERAVLSLVLKGLSNAEIAVARQKSSSTVGNQIAAIYRKLGVNSRRELFARARASETT